MSQTVGPAHASASASVVICAYTIDRWDQLLAAIESAAFGSVRPDQIIVVIDHNDALLARMQQQVRDQGPVPVTVVANCHTKGLSGARNTAVQTAEHDVVVFLDDDAIAAPDWLEAVLAPYTDDRVVAVGGAATPIWPVEQPARPLTLPAVCEGYGDLDWVIGCSYHGQPTTATTVRNLMGCNMSFRRVVFSRTHGFNEDLGRIGKTPLGCEETELCIRLRQLDPAARIVFEPAALVHHQVSPDRMTWGYLVRRGFAEGVSKAAVATMTGPTRALATERSYVTNVLVKAVVRELGRGLRGDTRGIFGAAAIGIGLGATTIGYVRGRLSTRRSHRQAISNSRPVT